MKNIFKKLLGLIVLFTLLFIFSCTEEFDAKNENDHQQNRNFEIKYKSFQQLMKEQKFNSAYKKVDQKIKTIKLASKTVMEEMYNFTIDTTVINEYHTSNYTSYNIGIIRDSLNNNYFENLFVEIDSSNVTTARILKYNINPINKLISSVETTPIIYNATNVTGKEAPGGEDCQTVSVYLQTQCGCPGHHWPGEGGCNCPNDPSTSTLLYSFTSCSSGGGGDVFDTGTLPSDPGTNILVTTTGGGSGSGSIAVPVVINYEKLRKNNLFKGTFFSLSERTWFFSQSEETQGAIMNYLESTLEDENGLILANVSEYSLEAKTFVKEVINVLINGGEVDFNLQVILDSSFSNNQRLKCIWNKINSGSNTINDYLDNFEPQFSVAHLKLKNDVNFSSNQSSNLWNAGAITVPPNNYVIDIIINSDSNLLSSSQNFPTIIIALEIIHETIHAEMFRKLMECAGLPNVNFNNLSPQEWEDFLITLMNNYPGLHDYFLRFEYNTANPTDSHHEMMAQHYINIMSNALKDFDNNAHDDSFYNALSWIGLKDTVAWDNLSQTQRDTIDLIIQNAIQNEDYNCTD